MKAPLPSVETIDTAAEWLARRQSELSCAALWLAWEESNPKDDMLIGWLRSGAVAASNLGANVEDVCPDDPLGHRLTWLALLRHFAEQGIDPLMDEQGDSRETIR